MHLRISKQLNIPWKDLFKRNKNITKKCFRNFSEKRCVLTLSRVQTCCRDLFRPRFFGAKLFPIKIALSQTPLAHWVQ